MKKMIISAAIMSVIIISSFGVARATGWIDYSNREQSLPGSAMVGKNREIQETPETNGSTEAVKAIGITDTTTEEAPQTMTSMDDRYYDRLPAADRAGGPGIAGSTAAEPSKAETGRSYDPSDLVDKVQLGLTQEEVKEQFGPLYAEFSNGLDDTPVWRYDYRGGKPLSPEEFTTNADEVDIKGLVDGTIQAQLYINWNDQGTRINSYAVYYMDREQAVVEYRVFPDGQTREMKIAG
ncbi:hypothetical protein [Paenibacillus sp. J2TS4]|uniref:hypothetical protein n=1 Tax=Paenibacillus sp. J2TS4 TaxID=2807194 RepID=UPI001B037888|nr:hypothetical protein [Paenibacillus sp. J2TS4]GIP35647.1 hypothetical protein J2TS4_48570 [Paenibacillus sp. J2TS4]